MFLDFALGVLRGLAAVGLASSLAALGWVAAVRWVAPDARAVVRFCAAAVSAWWLATAVFWLLSPVRGFRLSVLLPGLLVAAWWAWRWQRRAGDPGAQLAADLRAVGRGLWAVRRHPAGALLGVALLFAGIALLRGTLAPPLGWDALTYHLVKAGRFVQAGGFTTELAPDAWRYYEYFPPGGALLWAWTLLAFPSGLLVTGLGTLQWVVTLVAVFAAARELGARAEVAVAAAVALGGMPSILGWLSSAYVDNFSLACFALGTVFVLRGTAGFFREAPFAAAALGLMVGVRFTTLPLLGLGLMLLAVPWWRSRVSPRGVVVAGLLLVPLVGAPNYVRAWVEQGSPLYPVPLQVGGQELSAGSRMFRDTHTMDPVPGWVRQRPFAPFAAAVLFAREPRNDWFLNPGPGLALLPVAALLGVIALLVRRRWVALVFLGGATIVILGSLWTESMEVYRLGVWGHTVGRFLLPGFAGLVLLAAAAGSGRRGRVAAVLLGLAGLGGLWWARPAGWALVEAPGVGGLLVVGFAGLAGLAGARAWARRGGSPAAAGGLAGLTLALGLAGANQLHLRDRYALYEAAADHLSPLFHMHPLNPYYAVAWPLWQALDTPGGQRVAVVTGWDGTGHNNYRYPLLGSELQNTVLYVPFARDGRLIDTVDREEVLAHASFGAWVRRLAAAEVDVVVSLPPRNTIEDYWLVSHPELFERWKSSDEHDRALAFRPRWEVLTPERLASLPDEG